MQINLDSGNEIVCENCNGPVYIFQYLAPHRSITVLRNSNSYNSLGKYRKRNPHSRRTIVIPFHNLLFCIYYSIAILLLYLPNGEELMSGSYFANSNLPLRLILWLMYLWVIDITVREIANLLSMDKTSTIQWFQYFRNICSQLLVWIHEQKYKLTGNSVVQTDKCLLVKWKYHRGHLLPAKWVFGMYHSTLHLGIFQFVENRTKDVLLNMIRENVHPNTTIWSNEWNTYRAITS